MKYFSCFREHYRALIRLGVPIVIGQLGIVFVGLADNIMVGRYGTSDLAAASFVNSVFNIPILFGIGFSYGLTPLVGQLFGRRDPFRIGRLLRNSLLVNGCVGILLTLLMGILYFCVDRMGQPAELLPLIRPYFLLQLASLIFLMLTNSFKQFADGITDTRTPMYIMLSSNLLNIIGNYILIYGEFGFPAMGLTGAGISTLIARALMLPAFAVLFYRRTRYRRYLVGYRRSGYNREDFFSLNKMGWMIGMQMGLETGLFSVTGVMVGWLGSIALASHQIVVSLSTLGFMVYYGIGAAISVRSSYFFGQGDRVNVRRSAVAGYHLILCLAVIVSLGFFLFRNSIGLLFTESEEVLRAVSVLIFFLLAFQFGDALQIAFANALRGVNDVVAMAARSFTGYFLIALPVCYFFGFILEWGLNGIWLGYPVGLTLTGVLLCLRFYRITGRGLFRILKTA
ncbi:MAG: MATE family efflux transporter [Culturomica sp.]|jgi:MATE family multidrug resistance protein|nr:MATE family efflux transporter [Culturomica sp.]